MRRALLAVPLVAAWLLASGPLVGAEDAIRLTADDASYQFADHMSFGLTAESASPIDDVVLHYTIGADETRNRRIPEFTPGTRVTAQHTETLARGQIPPASVVTWWWTVADRAGHTAETPRQSFRYLDEHFKWQSTGGEDVNVWWYGAPASFADGLATRARAALVDLAGRIGTRPDQTIQIVTYQNREDMRAALPDRGSVFEERLATLGSRVAPDILLLLAGDDNPELADVLHHELSHIVLHLHLAKEYLSVPAWLDEGLAMYVEGHLMPDEARTLRDATRSGKLMSLRSMTTFPGQADLVPLAYAESRDVVAWLIETRGEARFRALLDALASGNDSADEALQQIYGADQLGLYQAYRQARGLAPAATPPPGGRPRQALAPRSWCGGAALVAPVLAAALWRRRRAAQVERPRRARR